MGHVAVAADLVGSIHDDDPAAVGQDAGGLAQQGGLAHAGPAQDQDTLARIDDVLEDVNRAVDGPSHPAGQPHDMPAPVADGGDAVQGAFQPGPVIGVEIADTLDDAIDVLVGDFLVAEFDLTLDEAGRGHASQVEDDFE